MSCIRHGEDDFTLITAASAQWHDREILTADLPETLSLTDVTKEKVALLVTGPKSRDLLAGLGEADLSLGWLTHQQTTVCGKDAMLARVSFAGELGWEVHVATEDAAEVYAAIREAGATPFGMYALDSMRIEKGYMTWKGDLSSDYSLLESGIDRFVRLTKEQDFPGKDALKAEAEAGVTKRMVTLVVEPGEQDAPYMAAVFANGDRVGEVTSSAYGYRVDKAIARAMLRADIAEPGTEVEVEIYGKLLKATVQDGSTLWDPENARIRA
jgi:dimethylglycine dehydrogenase